MPNFEMPNLDSVNHCTSKENQLVQWLTESRFGISKFGIPIEIRSWDRDYGWGVRVRRPFGARGMSSVRYRTRLGDLKNKQSTESRHFGARGMSSSVRPTGEIFI